VSPGAARPRLVQKGYEFAPVPADRRPDRRVAQGVAPRSHRLIGVEVNATWAIGISLAALTFSVYCWIRGFSITRRLATIEFERRGEELAANASASVSARIRKDPVPGSDIHLHAKLVIHNAGPARAEGIMLEPVNPEDAILPDSYLEKWFPWSLDASEDHEITAIISHDTPPIVEARLTWSDALGDHSTMANLSTM
jgi:hypothetical protein